jgi:hypothetical protein
MIATTSLGSLVVNLGQLDQIPCGERRLFQVGRQYLAVFHTQDSGIYAAEADSPQKKYPTAVNGNGDILVGVEGLWARR